MLGTRWEHGCGLLFSLVETSSQDVSMLKKNVLVGLER